MSVLKGFALSLFVLWAMLSVAGLFAGQNTKPLVAFNACVGHGTTLTLAFNSNPSFVAVREEFGPDYFRSRVAFIGWPGGLIGYLTVDTEEPVCLSKGLINFN